MRIVGYVTEEEAAALIGQGWQLEPAEAYRGLVGQPGSGALLIEKAANAVLDAVVIIITDKSIPEVLAKIKAQDSTKLLNLEEYTVRKLQLESELGGLIRRCAHKYADGSSMVTPSPHGQGETYCPNCGNKWD